MYHPCPSLPISFGGLPWPDLNLLSVPHFPELLAVPIPEEGGCDGPREAVSLIIVVAELLGLKQNKLGGRVDSPTVRIAVYLVAIWCTFWYIFDLHWTGHQKLGSSVFKSKFILIRVWWSKFWLDFHSRRNGTLVLPGWGVGAGNCLLI